MKRKRGLLAVLLLLACSSLDIEELPTEVTLTVDRTSAAVGEEFEFTWEATGSFLAGAVLDFGDGTPADSLELEGAQRATARRTHAYAESGSYVVTATIEEANNETASDAATVEVTGG